MKVFQEVTTNWNTDFEVPNHIYFLSDSKDKLYGYVKASTGTVETLKKPLKFNATYRKFKEIPNTFNFVIEEEVEKQVGQNWIVKGSKGDSYTVNLVDGHYSCTCSGFRFRGQCKHIASVKA